ncbi:MAG: 3'-5' exonuclease [Deltaproteobacteria bacterium]|nr:3'-5' exonuclease [Deltaproteobacteria bacterium]
MLDLVRDLNERQLEAARHVDGPLLVIAGAGSGKTRVITYRIANLVMNHGVPPRRIMAVTFTNKAAGEMKERVARLLGQDAIDCWVSTFHASCARLLRIHGERVGVNPRFTIYDDQDQKAMVARCLKELDFGDKIFPPRAVQSEINKARQELKGPQEYEAHDFYREKVRRAYELYEKRMREACALDFGDLLYRPVRAMRDDPELAAEIAGRFSFVLVDEFQDTNLAQLELVRLLGRPHRNVCVVGDDDQSIYSWRGADVGNILDFEKHFPGARVVTLDRNYRSTSRILKAAHGVVSKLADRRPKELWTKNPDGEPVTLVEAPDEREEARLVARAVQELVSEGTPLSEQAVFYRVNAQSRVFEEVLRTYDIPHRVVGGMRFYERAEVKDVLAYLRLVQNPADAASFLRVVNTPSRGIGKTTIDRLMALAAGRGVSPVDAIELAAGTDIGSAQVKRLTEWKGLLDAWRLEIDAGPAALARRILEETGYVEGLTRENNAEADARLENLEELVGSIADFEREAESPTLDAFLELVTLRSDVDETRFDGEELTLMTVHSAKGLEFDAVFVTGLEEGMFPYRSAADRGLGSDPKETAEERRLCYVAMTRARKRLFLTLASRRQIFGNTRCEPPSRFLSDIPADILLDVTPRPKVVPVRAPVTGRAPGQVPGRVAAVPRHRETWVDRSFDQTAESMPALEGRTVRHARFGVGKVLAVHEGAVPKVDVSFPGFGKKTILLSYLELD